MVGVILGCQCVCEAAQSLIEADEDVLTTNNIENSPWRGEGCELTCPGYDGYDHERSVIIGELVKETVLVCVDKDSEAMLVNLLVRRDLMDKIVPAKVLVVQLLMKEFHILLQWMHIKITS